jgi:hypothetical protein
MKEVHFKTTVYYLHALTKIANEKESNKGFERTEFSYLLGSENLYS